jgi:serine/threonine protein phosphatase PrpC
VESTGSAQVGGQPVERTAPDPSNAPPSSQSRRAPKAPVSATSSTPQAQSPAIVSDSSRPGRLGKATAKASKAIPTPKPVRETLSQEVNRRLSLDGDLPDAAKRPDAQVQTPDDEYDRVDDDDDVDRDGDGDDNGSDVGHGPHSAPAASSRSRRTSFPHGEGVIEVANVPTVSVLRELSGCSKAGWEPPRAPHMPGAPVEVRKENQDAFCAYSPFASSPRQIFLGVFDGHGAAGRAIAQFVRDEVPRHVQQFAASSEQIMAPAGPEPLSVDMHKAVTHALKSSFSRAERRLTESDAQIDHVFSGTTAVVSWFLASHVYTAWAGDSRSVMGRVVPASGAAAMSAADRPAGNSDSGRLMRYRAIELSHDQKPVRADEKKRVKTAGGRIARWRRNIGPLRVWLPRDWTPGLAMTRSIGDTVLSEYGVSPVPEVTYTRLTPSDSFAVLASDGVWEFMTSQDVVDFVGRFRRESKSAAVAAEALVREAVRRWRRNEVVVDDTTAIVMWIDNEAVGSTGVSSTGQAGARANGGLQGSAGITSPPRTALQRFMRSSVSMSANDSPGVCLVSDDGRLGNFVCKNDVVLT